MNNMKIENIIYANLTYTVLSVATLLFLLLLFYQAIGNTLSYTQPHVSCEDLSKWCQEGSLHESSTVQLNIILGDKVSPVYLNQCFSKP